MKEKDLPIDLTKHKVYSRNARKCVLKLLHRYYDEQSAAKLWEKVQLQYCCIVGDKNPIAAEYELKQADNGLWISAKKRHPKETQT